MTENILWNSVRIKLGDLKPWKHNPRKMTKKRAQKLLESWKKFGQVQTVAIDPENEILDGHQRLSALLTLYGKDYELDARQSNRRLSEKERRELVIALHALTLGQWDWDVLSSWDEKELYDIGFDVDLLQDWNMDALNLREFLTAGFGYNPNTSPSIGDKQYTKDDIEKAANKLNTKFIDGKEYIEVLCPNCGETFYLSKDDIR